MIRSGSIACGFALLLGELGWAQGTERVDVSVSGGNANGDASTVSISANGRFVAFDSDATNLVSGDTNGFRDVFVRDRVLGTTELVSRSTNGAQGNNYSVGPRISPNGRFVAFQSAATNLVSGDTNGLQDIFVRDRAHGTTVRVSISSTGAQGNGMSYAAAISDDDRFVAFTSVASNLVAGDSNNAADVFVRDSFLQVTERVSVDSNGVGGSGPSGNPSISDDGLFVAFESLSPLVAPDTNGTYDVFVRDRFVGTTVRISEPPGFGTQANGASADPVISRDGDYVVFSSQATNLVSGDTNLVGDIFLRERTGSTVERLSVSSSGAQGDFLSYSASISADERFVAFVSEATNLVAGDTNFVADLFVRDRELGVTERLSVDSAGVQGNNASYESSITADGRCVAFVSYATNLVSGDTNSLEDAFVRDRSGGPSFTSLCHPGYGEVRSCPCANPPSGAGPGCNNSSNTGGAILSATGVSALSNDTLTFTTSGQCTTGIGTSYVCQGTGLMPTGFLWGQGVRCLNGWLRRLYTKTAVGGSITAPDIGAGDLPVSVISAIVGDTIQPGESRWYAVCYRDPNFVCGSFINATQTGEVVWAP